LKELEDIVNPILKRKSEALKRPEAVKELKDTIAHLKEVVQLVDSQIKTQIHDSSKSSEAVASKSSASVSASASPSASSSTDELDDLEEDSPSTSSEAAEPEITEVPTIYTEDDLKKLQDLMASSEKWLEENHAKQEKLKATDDPVLTLKDIQEEKKRMDDLIMDMMMKKMRHFKPPTQKPKAKPKAKPKKKSAKKDSKKAAEEGPSEEELQEALKKAGVNSEGIKLKNFGQKDEMEDDKGRKLKKLNIDKDATEEEILKAIEDLTKDGAEEKKHDEL
jgi:hypoxia up-regulated 1